MPLIFGVRRVGSRLRRCFLVGILGTAELYALEAANRAQFENRPTTPVILISIDTLRADHLSCYGYQKIRTPHLDSFGTQGTIFWNAGSPVPMTLPAHTSLLTSTYPFVHGVEENGGEVPRGAVTLAGVLQSHGYGTAAFIGGYVLDAQFGLDRGFDSYDSPFHIHPQPGQEPLDLKRPAESVLHATALWLEKHADQPFFVFVHLYDLHQPYERRPLPGLSAYDTELSHLNEAIGQFWTFLETQGLVRKALIIVTSDHGESLGEHGEKTHGYFIYQSTLWVPLIVHWPVGVKGQRARIDTPASLIDVAPTILQFLGVPQPPEFQGRSLLATDRTAADEEVYSESLYARNHLGCSALRSLRLGRYKYIEKRNPELYDLTSDPRELRNLYQEQRPVALDLQRRLSSLMGRYEAQHPAQKPASAEVMARLRSLGYLGSAAPQNASLAPDPKDRLGEYLRYGDAIRFASTGHVPEAIRAFQDVLKQDGSNLLSHFYLAVCYYRLHRIEEAVKELNTTLTIAPVYSQAEELLGTIWLQEKDYAKARQQFAHLLTIAPGDYGAHYNLGILAIRDGQWADAARELSAAVEADPASAPTREALGSVYLQLGDLGHAQLEFARAIELDPMFVRAHDGLGKVFLLGARPMEAATEFREALRIDPTDEEARKSLQHLQHRDAVTQ